MKMTSNQLPPVRKGRYHRIDGWRGYNIPGNAVAGSSDTGTWSDSPCPTPAVMGELRRFTREVLKANGIRYRMGVGSSSNVFCGKRWVVVKDRSQFPLAAQLTLDWLEANNDCTRYIHSADQDQLGYEATNDFYEAMREKVACSPCPRAG